MAIMSSPTIEKILGMKGSPRILSGYPYVPSNEDAEGRFHLYPALDPDRYFEIDEGDVVEIIDEAGDRGRKAVVLNGTARLHLVQRTSIAASDLDDGDDGWTARRGKLPPWADRLTAYLLLASASLLQGYLGTESIPGTGQTGRPEEDL